VRKWRITKRSTGAADNPVSEIKSFAGGPVTAIDYEVLGLEVVKPLFLQISFLHDQCSWIGAFVGAACRSLTRAQRVFERSEWRLTSGADEGTGAFVGELRGSGFRVAFRLMSRMVD
jgi:hypothetical protein